MDKPRDKELTLRDWLEQREYSYLHGAAQKSSETRGRLYPEPQCTVRTVYQRDRDRIIHCKAFRRLKHKTQVFLSPTGDHYRTRLTHTLEVSQIARTIGKALALNEDLIEAIALGHDLGHTPFGHAGEEILNEIHPGGFCHSDQSLRVVDYLERNGRGLNLTFEVRDGIVKHSKGRDRPVIGDSPEEKPITLEGQVVKVADIVAYINHDLDDAVRAGILTFRDIPYEIRRNVGDTHGARIHNLVEDIIRSTLTAGMREITLSPRMMKYVELLREFLFERVYTNSQIRQEFNRAHKIIEDLYRAFLDRNDLFHREIGEFSSKWSRERQVCDYIAGMTDRYALYVYQKIFLPRPWMKF